MHTDLFYCFNYFMSIYLIILFFYAISDIYVRLDAIPLTCTTMRDISSHLSCQYICNLGAKAKWPAFASGTFMCEAFYLSFFCLLFKTLSFFIWTNFRQEGIYLYLYISFIDGVSSLLQLVNFPPIKKIFTDFRLSEYMTSCFFYLLPWQRNKLQLFRE